MRLVGVFKREDQIGGLVDSLRNVGIDRKDIVISDKPKTNYRHSAMDEVYIKTETDNLENLSTLSDMFPNEANEGILVAVEVPRSDTSQIREIMEQNGAVKIILD